MFGNHHHHRRVLVVEDEWIVRVEAAACLMEAGFDVVQAVDAAEALEIVQGRDDIDLLFTDINMPGSMNGVELARRVHRARPAMRLILTSGETKPSASELPIDGDFIPKPYSPDTVTAAVNRQLAVA